MALRLNSSQTADLLKKKDEQIQGLMEEGENFQAELNNSTIMKKLRAKDKDHENVIAELKRKLRAGRGVTPFKTGP